MLWDFENSFGILLRKTYDLWDNHAFEDAFYTQKENVPGWPSQPTMALKVQTPRCHSKKCCVRRLWQSSMLSKQASYSLNFLHVTSFIFFTIMNHSKFIGFYVLLNLWELEGNLKGCSICFENPVNLRIRQKKCLMHKS